MHGIRSDIRTDHMNAYETSVRNRTLTNSKQIFSDATLRRAADEEVRYYSTPRVEKFTTLLIGCIITVLLAIPVFLMYRVSWDADRDMVFLNGGLLVFFTLLFSASMSLLTEAKRAELFAASAAYCAVLIVFVGNFSGQDR